MAYPSNENDIVSCQACNDLLVAIDLLPSQLSIKERIFKSLKSGCMLSCMLLSRDLILPRKVGFRAAKGRR